MRILGRNISRYVAAGISGCISAVAQREVRNKKKAMVANDDKM